jgi:dienelactone hydrolase
LPRNSTESRTAAILSLTLSDQQFLTGKKGDKPVTVAGELRIAQGNGRLPVVVLMHGSGGIGAGPQAWAGKFNSAGISTFTIDGFTGRGLAMVGSNQAALGRCNLIIDIFRSLEILEKHPAVDASRIGLMGFSRGGQAALYASVERFRRMWKTSEADFAAYIPFYPDCGTTYLNDETVAARPIRVFHGPDDDANSVSNTKKYIARLRSAGADVELTEYAGAHHTFDNPLLFGKIIETSLQSVCNCDIREIEDGLLVNTATGKPFSYDDACVQFGPHVGGDAAATQHAYEAVLSLLYEQFGLMRPRCELT